MMRFISACCLILLAACGTGREQPPAEEAMGDGAMAGDDAFAGTWSMRVMPEGRDTTVLTFTMAMTAGSDGWTLSYPDRPPVPVTVVSREGETATIEAGPYESPIRKGVQVRIRSDMRREGEKLVGTASAHYEVTTADSVVRFRLEGTRTQ